MKAKNILITGSSRGIGAACARALAAQTTASDSGERVKKYHLVLHGRTESSALKALASELGADFIAFDVGDRETAREALSRFTEPFWGVVLNAGITADGTFAGLDAAAWDSVIGTNLGSFFNVLNPLIMPMARAKRGRIVVMSSVSGQIGNRGQSNYAASKAGLIGAAKSLATELASRSITVNVVAPGLIETDMTADIPADFVKSAIPMGRAGQPGEVAGLVKFLLGDGASYITRQVIGVNGGLI